jgi:hypothetical protein
MYKGDDLMGKIINMQEYMNQKEQKDQEIAKYEQEKFIDLLRYFVKTQEPRINTIILNLLNDSKFEILDINGAAINNEILKNILIETTEDMDVNLDFSDLLLSSLITLNPSKIILKQNNKNNLDLTILYQVFDNIEIINSEAVQL